MSGRPQCALIIGNLWLVGDVGIRKRVLTLLHQRSQTLADLRAVLKEHHDSLGDEGVCLLCSPPRPVRMRWCLQLLLHRRRARNEMRPKDSVSAPSQLLPAVPQVSRA